jgi:energy-coupling factor transporter ATP-binding protein EcfA2
VNEKVQRLVMHAFRGVPGQMTVDFGKGESIAVYGDNGTGKSTIADALEWYFTGQIELLSHEGRQHAVRYVGGESDGVTAVESSRPGPLAARLCCPTSGTRRRSTQSGTKPSCFADAPLPISSTRPRRRNGRRSSKSSAWTQSRVFEKICNGRGTSCAKHSKPQRNSSAPTSVP